jgi:predicted nucleic acid-binding protein
LNSLVLDGSTTLGFLLEDERFSQALNASKVIEEGRTTYVPVHWWLETANGLLMSERRKRISQVKTSEALHVLYAMPVITDQQTAIPCNGDTASLARQYELTIHDAAYLELAMRCGSVLATADRELAAAAHRAGVEVLS